MLPRRYASPDLVARGGMGEVYRATDTALERTVAIKVLSDRYARQDDARARFRREALAAARVSAAPNVVTVFDVAEHDGRPLIVMEYLEGGSVYERLRSRACPRALRRSPGSSRRRTRSTAHMRAASSIATSSRRTSSSIATTTSTSPTSGSRPRRERTCSRSREPCSAPRATSPRSRLGANRRPRRATATRSRSWRSSS